MERWMDGGGESDEMDCVVFGTFEAVFEDAS
jgi:hypothetical protein